MLPASPVQVLEQLADNVHEDIHTSLPARVLAFHPEDQTVDIEFTTKVPVVDTQSREVTWEKLPNLSRVPVMYQGGGGFEFSFPLAKGNFVWVMVPEVCTGQFQATGRVPSEGPETRYHGLGSSWCMPASPRPQKSRLASVSILRLGKSESDERIEIGSDIKLGAGASDFVALSNKVDAILSALNTHCHPTTAPGSPTGPPGPSPAGTPPFDPWASVAAAKVKAQ